MSKHTPGPWRIGQSSSLSEYLTITDADGNAVALVVSDSIQCGTERTENNAHLIEAAPELLDALEAIIAHERHLLNPYRVLAARDAIRKATGVEAELGIVRTGETK